MKITVKMGELELETAVKEFLEKRGYTKVNRVSFSQDGFPDSTDPREQSVSYSASVECEQRRKNER